MPLYLTKIKEFSTLVSQANKLGIKEIKLDRAVAVELLSEINILLAATLEQEKETTVDISGFNGGSFK